MNNFKKILSIIISVLLILSVVPFAAFANEAVATKGSADISVDDEYIYGLNAEGTQFSDVKDQFANPDEVTADSDAFIGTGTVFTIGAETRTAILFGDVDGDGAIDGFDLFLVDKDINNIAKLDGIFAFAGDTDDDGAVDIDDYNAIRAQIAGEELVDQRTALPTATIEEADAEAIGSIPALDGEVIAPQAAFDLKANQTAEDIAEKEYKDWTVDLILTFSDAVNAEDVYLFGNYGDYGWLGNSLEPVYTGTLAAGTEIKILSKWLASIEPSAGSITYAQVVENVQNFASAIYVDGAEYGLTATVKLVMTDGEGNQHVIDTFEYMWTTDPVAPKVIRVAGSTVGEIPYGDGSVSADTAVRIDFKEIAEEIADREYAEWKTDVVVSFNKALNAEDVYFFGNYANTGWIGGNIAEAPMYAGQTIAADQEICLVADWFGSVSGKNIQPTYEEVLSKTGDKLAAIHVDGDTTDLVVTVKITLTDNEGNVKVLAEGTYSYAKPVAPEITRVATDTIGNNGAVPYGDGSVAVDAALKMEFQETVADIADKEYKDWPTDVVISFNKDLNSEDVYLFGKYGTHEWMGGNLEGYPINANEGIALVDWFAAITGADGLEVTYEDVIKRTDDKLAALHVDGDTDGLVVTVSVVVTDPVTGEKTVLKSDTYSYAKPVAPVITRVATDTIGNNGAVPYGDGSVAVDAALKMEFQETVADIADKEYKDWPTDVVISFNKDLNSEDVYLFGKYGTHEWMGGNLEGYPINANEGIALVDWFAAITGTDGLEVTYEDVIKRTGDKLAALHVDGDTDGLVVTVSVVMTDPVTGEKTVLKSDTYSYAKPVAPKVTYLAPTDLVDDGEIPYGDTTVKADTAIKMEFKETPDDIADKPYKDWKTDVVISFSENLNGEDVYIFGKYATLNWMGGNLEGIDITADTGISLIEWFSAYDSRVSTDITYSEVIARMGEKLAALHIDGDTTDLKVTVKIILTDPVTGEEMILEQGDYTYINVPKPTVEIVNDTSTVGNAGSLEGYISNDVVEADVAITMAFAETAADVADKEYKDWNTDIEISFNQDLNAEDVYFFGKYGSHDWIGDNLAVAPAYNGKTIKAGETVSLVSKWFSSFDSRALAAKYSDVLARQDYKSAALYVAGAMAGLEITVNIVLTDPDTGARVVIASGGYTYE